jgi:hypothetical protein
MTLCVQAAMVLFCRSLRVLHCQVDAARYMHDMHSELSLVIADQRHPSSVGILSYASQICFRSTACRVHQKVQRSATAYYNELLLHSLRCIHRYNTFKMASTMYQRDPRAVSHQSNPCAPRIERCCSVWKVVEMGWMSRMDQADKVGVES